MDSPVKDDAGNRVITWATVLLLLALFAAVGAVIYAAISRSSNNQPSTNKSKLKRCVSSSMDGVTIAFASLFAVLTTLVLLLIAAFAAVRAQEQSRLFQPQLCSRYKNLSGLWYNLKNGGGLLHLNPKRNVGARRLLFCHGNSLSLGAYADPLNDLSAQGFDVYGLEYGGYGRARGSKALDSPNCESLLLDLHDAWRICGDSNTVICGFSLGGLLLGESYDHLSPAPAQIVFINSVTNFPALVAEKLGNAIGSAVGPLLRTQWCIKAPKCYSNQVLIVYTKDDAVVPPSQGRQLCCLFQSLNPKCIVLPSGGHRKSALLFRNLWSPSLLPPQI
jgi:hypothetical protein